MKSNRIYALALAVVSVAGLTACQSKNTVQKASESGISELQTEAVTDKATDSTKPTEETLPPETYPDFPISYPEIEKKSTGDLYEAEYARMTEGLKIEGAESAETAQENSTANTAPAFSGDGYVTGFKSDGSDFIVFDVDTPSNQHYDLSFSIASDLVVDCKVSLNGSEISNFKTIDDGEFTLITLYGVFLVKGQSEIELRATDGNMKVDYLKIADNTSLSEISYNASNVPVNSQAGESAKELLSFLTSNYGRYTITGQYASSPENEELELVYQTTGKYPVIRFSAIHNSGNSFDSTFKDIDACADWYRKGGIVGLMWYWEAPSKKSSVYADETDFVLANAVTDIDIANLTQEEIRGLYGEGKISEQCYGLILDIDNMAGQLMSLKNKGVPVLWRPLHEASGDWFWWGGDTESYKWLWNLMYRRFTEYFALDNLIWVWNGQSESTLVDKDTFDIASLDIYMGSEKDYGSRYEQFLALQKIVGKEKLIALSECSEIPDIDASFRDNSVWSFFGLWYGKYIKGENGGFSEEFMDRDSFIRSYNSEGVISLDEYIKLCGGDELVPQYETETTTASSTVSTEFSTISTSGETTEYSP
ncbi:MAG: glycoside hydrolase [Ruminococcus flavefaciens]|nr:glycoside hydrolase [Ruminococcus flavefaciens]MCM1228736.1 glycoside hydrolase [Ruminococcus flavefaciens]